MNILEIIGRLGKDPESRFTPSGLKVTNFNVATTIYRSGKEDTIWVRVTVWGDRFDKILSHLKKGSGVVIVGEMSKPEIWTDKEGRPQVSLELTADIIRFMPSNNPDRENKESGHGASHNSNNATGSYGAAPAQQSYGNEPYNNSSSQGSASGHGSASHYSPAANEEALPF